MAGGHAYKNRLDTQHRNKTPRTVWMGARVSQIDRHELLRRLPQQSSSLVPSADRENEGNAAHTQDHNDMPGSMVGRYSTSKVDFWLLTPFFPLFMNKQRLLHFSLSAVAWHARACCCARCLSGGGAALVELAARARRHVSPRRVRLVHGL